MTKPQLYEEMQKYGIPEIRISPEVWREKYNNTYNILGLDSWDKKEESKIAAAEDIVMIYLLLEAKKVEVKAP